MANNDHPNKEIRAAVDYALGRGWRLRKSNGHIWGVLYCPHADRDGCRFSVYSTPRNTHKHALRIRSEVDDCPHA